MNRMRWGVVLVLMALVAGATAFAGGDEAMEAAAVVENDVGMEKQAEKEETLILPEGLTEEMVAEVEAAADTAGLDTPQTGQVVHKVIWSVEQGLPAETAVMTATDTLATPDMDAAALTKATREALLEAVQVMKMEEKAGKTMEKTMEKVEEKSEAATDMTEDVMAE